MNVKQVIVVRKDLKMRRGKEVAQGAHASMLWLRERLTLPDRDFTEPEKAWLFGDGFKKVVVQVDSLAELGRAYDEAKKAGLEAHFVVDSGLTEFGGVPTITCLAVGPDLDEKVDRATGHLKLY